MRNDVLQPEETTTPEGWAKLERVESGNPDAMMDDGELPVDANGEFVSGDPVDPKDPRTAHMKPAGKSSPPDKPAVSPTPSGLICNLCACCCQAALDSLT